ncbi:hypothetical protein BDZ45DRAFT_769661 [Neofusicoccum parvum]|nr:hypothetical protein BDZ45DRAFT_769661 [Neofusicoccum parvum]
MTFLSAIASSAAGLCAAQRPPPSPPLSCPEVDPDPQATQVFDAIRARWRDATVPPPIPTASLPTPSWACFALSPDQHQTLQRRIAANEGLERFVNFKLRWDYDPGASELVLRVPSVLHEILVKKLTRRIESELERLARAHPELGDAIEEIYSSGSATLYLPGKIRRDPDEQFCCGDAYWPTAVIEVSHSQKRRALPAIAESYIRGSGGQIAVVVGFDVEYGPGGRQPSKEAAILLWRVAGFTETNAQGERKECKRVDKTVQVIRTAAGDVVPGYLKMQLCDFLHPSLTNAKVKAAADGLTIQISHTELCAYLEQAEKKRPRTPADVADVPDDISWHERQETPRRS